MLKPLVSLKIQVHKISPIYLVFLGLFLTALPTEIFKGLEKVQGDCTTCQ